MKRYIFCDWDEVKKIEYDILGQDYLDLLSLCFQHCSSFTARYAVSVYYRVDIPQYLQKFRIPLTVKNTAVYKWYGYSSESCENEVAHFSLSAEVMDFLVKRTDDFFRWIANSECQNLEDLAFFRKDGSVFLHSSTHNGVCILEPLDTEDVSRVISKPGWEPDIGQGTVLHYNT